jgi:hypothetical protein
MKDQGMLVAESNQKPDIDMRFLTAMARQSSMNNRSSLKIATQNCIKTSNCRLNLRSQQQLHNAMVRNEGKHLLSTSNASKDIALESKLGNPML